MSKKRKNQNRTLPSRQCKKSKTISPLRKNNVDVNYDESSYNLLDYLDESEIIEISSDDRSEVVIVDCVNPTRFTSIAQKDQDWLEEMSNSFEDSPDIDVGQSAVANLMSTRNTISISGSETMSSVRSNKRRTKSCNKQIIKPMIEEMYIVEKILAMREIDGMRQFFLKWEGFPDSENSWEPEENIDSKDIIMDYLAELENVEQTMTKHSNVATRYKEARSRSSSIHIHESPAVNSECTMGASSKGSIVDVAEKENVSNTIENGNEIIEKYKEKKASKKKSKKISSKKTTKSKRMSESEIDLTLDDEEVREEAPSTIDPKMPESDGIVVEKEGCEDKSVAMEEIEGPEKLIQIDATEELAKEVTPDSSDCVLVRSVSGPSNKDEADDGETSDKAEEVVESDEESDEAKDDGGPSDSVSKPQSVTDQRNAEDDSKSRTSVNSQRNVQPPVSCVNPHFPCNLDQDGQEIFQVEKILRMRWNHGVRYFYLKWEGFPESENSWEPESYLECPELIEEFLNDLKKPRTRRRSEPGEGTATSTTTTTSETRRPLVLETLPDETRIREPLPTVKSKGFPKEREPEVILASGIINDELSFLIKWKNVDMANVVPARRANAECPQMVIRFYENNLRWQNIDGSMTSVPDDRITVDDSETEELRRLQRRLERQELRARLKASRQSSSICDLVLSSSTTAIKSPMKKNKNPGKGRGRPLGAINRPMMPSLPPGMAQSRKLATGASKMLNIIHNFQARKKLLPGINTVTPLTTTTTMTAPSVPSDDRDRDDLVARLYDSMDMSAPRSKAASATLVASDQYESRDLPIDHGPSTVTTTTTTMASFHLPPPIAATPRTIPVSVLDSGHNNNHYQQQQHQPQSYGSKPLSSLLPPLSLSLSRSFRSLSSSHLPVGNSPLARTFQPKANSSIMAGPRSFQQSQAYSRHSSPTTTTTRTPTQGSQGSHQSLRPPPPPAKVAITSRSQYLCPIQKQNSIDQLVSRGSNGDQSLPSFQYQMMSPDQQLILIQAPQPQSQSQQQQQSQPLFIQHQPQQVNINESPLYMYTPSQQYQAPGATVQYQYIVHNNSYQPVATNTGNNYVVTPTNHNQIYYSPQQLVQTTGDHNHQSSPPIQILSEMIGTDYNTAVHDNQLPPVMFDSQSQIQTPQHTNNNNNNSQLSRNTYLNLGAYL